MFDSARCYSQESIKDFTNIVLEEHGIEPVEPQKEPETGFVIAGQNPTSLIKLLTQMNGKRIDELESIMRPGKSSDAGFLGKEESLLEIMAVDNKYVVDDCGLTHQELARHTELIVE